MFDRDPVIGLRARVKACLSVKVNLFGLWADYHYASQWETMHGGETHPARI